MAVALRLMLEGIRMGYARTVKLTGIVLLLIFAYFGIGGAYSVWHRKVWGVENTYPPDASVLCLDEGKRSSVGIGALVMVWPAALPFTFGKWVFDMAGGK